MTETLQSSPACLDPPSVSASNSGAAWRMTVTWCVSCTSQHSCLSFIIHHRIYTCRFSSVVNIYVPHYWMWSCGEVGSEGHQSSTLICWSTHLWGEHQALFQTLYRVLNWEGLVDLLPPKSISARCYQLVVESGTATFSEGDLPKTKMDETQKSPKTELGIKWIQHVSASGICKIHWSERLYLKFNWLFKIFSTKDQVRQLLY